MDKIIIVGIGPGAEDYVTPQAQHALEQADVIVGYKYYLDLLRPRIEGKEWIATGMKRERDRAVRAFEMAEAGRTVAVVSSGDAGIYGMASLLYEMKQEDEKHTELEVVPGISAMLGAAAKLGAPLGHDFCSLSMSDLLTPWELIEKRIQAAAMADFVTAIYNPVSRGRFWQLMRFKEIFLEYRSPDTPVGVARQVGRDEESTHVVALKDLTADMADMFTVLIVGNSQSRSFDGFLYTPRGYYDDQDMVDQGPGRNIMNQSFRTILNEIAGHSMDPETLWVALHVIHTTADTGIWKSLHLTGGVVQNLYNQLYSAEPPVIVTDVTMVGSGIRKALAEKTGLQIKCYLSDPRTRELADYYKITRTQAGIRLATEKHPNALFAIGNAPTALMELVGLIRKGKANPVAVIGAPVGFVNVKEAKWQLKYGCPGIPHIILEGRRGGSNIAATIINAVLSWKDADCVNPGEGL